jgi:hypothetical protein
MEWLINLIEHPLLLIPAIVLAFPVIKQYFKWFFGDLGGFTSDVSLSAMPDIYAMFKGKYLEGEWAELKIFFFILTCICLIAFIYKIASLIFY